MKKGLLVLVICTFVAAPAFADLGTVMVDYQGASPKMDVPVVDNRPGVNRNSTFYTGVYNLLLTDATAYTGWLKGTVQSFCIDMDDTASGDPHLYAIKELDDAPDGYAGPMYDTKARHLAELLDENWAWGTTVTSSLQAAAIQLAVWEIVGETSGTYNLTMGSGSVYLNSTGPNYWDTGDVGTVAQAMLNAISAAGHDYIDRYVAVSHPIGSGTEGYQDYVVRVPLPGAVLLGMLGLSVAGARLRRRSA